MGLFDIFKSKNDDSKLVSYNNENDEDNEIIETANYMLTEMDTSLILQNGEAMPLSNLANLGSDLASILPQIKDITSNKSKNKKGEALYRVINLKSGDTLKYSKKNKYYYGAISKKDKKSTMAHLKKANTNSIVLDPNMMIVAMALHQVEKKLSEIKDVCDSILTFLERDKESEIKADLEVLKNILNELKYNKDNSTFLSSKQIQVDNIKRTAKKNIIFYKKAVEDDLKNESLFTNFQSMNSIQNNIQKKFMNYRLSLFDYSFASLLEIRLINNFDEDYLNNKKEELSLLDKEYLDNYEIALKYIKKNANKSLEGNILSGIGSAEKTIGNLIGKVKLAKDKNVDKWFHESGNNLKEKGQNIKDNYSDKFSEINKSNIEPIIENVELLNNICNNTKDIYFDDKNIYIEFNK